MQWQRTLAALACTCTFFRRTLSGPDADCLYSAVAVVGLRPATSEALLQALCSRAQAIRCMQLDWTGLQLQPRQLMQRCTSLERFDVTGLDTSSSVILAAMFPDLPNLVHLVCSGPDLGALDSPPRPLPSGLTSLELTVQPLPQDFTIQEDPTWVKGLCGLDVLCSLSLEISGSCPEEAAAAGSMFGLLKKFNEASSLPSLRELTIVHTIPLEDWRSQCNDRGDPVGYLTYAAGVLGGYVEATLKGPNMLALQCLTAELYLPRDSARTAASGITRQVLHLGCAKYAASAPAWVFFLRFSFTCKDNKRQMDHTKGWYQLG